MNKRPEAARSASPAGPGPYFLLQSGPPRRYGVWCRAGGVLLAAAPFTSSRREAERIVRRLNRARTPPRLFREAVLSGALGPPAPEWPGGP